MVEQSSDGTVEFRFYRPGATHVAITGEFNGWNEKGWPMRAQGDGWWACNLMLAPGFYEFQYLADRERYLDYAAFGLNPGPLGLNSVVKVDAITARPKSHPSAKPLKVHYDETSKTNAA